MEFNPLTTLCPAVVLLVTVHVFFSLAFLWFLPSGKLLQQLEMVSSLTVISVLENQGGFHSFLMEYVMIYRNCGVAAM